MQLIKPEQVTEQLILCVKFADLQTDFPIELRAVEVSTLSSQVRCFGWTHREPWLNPELKGQSMEQDVAWLVPCFLV